MSTYYYRVNWYPYGSYLKAKNYKDAWRKLKELYGERKSHKKFAVLLRCR